MSGACNADSEGFVSVVWAVGAGREDWWEEEEDAEEAAVVDCGGARAAGLEESAADMVCGSQRRSST